MLLEEARDIKGILLEVKFGAMHGDEAQAQAPPVLVTPGQQVRHRA